MENRQRDTGLKEEQGKKPVTDPGRKEPPKRHEQAPARKPAPTRPAPDSDPGGVPEERDSEESEDRGRMSDEGGRVRDLGDDG